ncbi:sce7725 family protein [Leeuwenhoekiella polynyae]|uniref:Sce7725 family protein n=1 Tax=Leeuwenhoekiella polynyae TaxID=1550906 RepID=A0A4V1KRP9_9FLAO|nr:sce7725 family protein [Leeuwenhoekiella polynyae]RXG25672.1 hypothetical protein DSM02_839 [Leeuwenhoekiella polynyae]
MYYPFLRGKQFEILAVKELSGNVLNKSEKISPIFELVKISPSLKNALPILVKNGINFNLIINPREGSLIGNYTEIIDFISKYLGHYQNYQIAIIIDNKTQLRTIVELLLKSKCTNRISLIHNRSQDNIDRILEYLNSNFEIISHIINVDNIRERYFLNFNKSSIVTLKDSFISQIKNSEYLKVGESEFSEEHLYFEKENLKGFSDFLTIGDKYMKGGFSPYAVAIHISYVYNEKVRVKHFVSDSNTDNTNVAGKYSEALEKLIAWENQYNLNTIAMKQFKEYYREQHYPGLGTIKKLSIMNHLEVIDRLL